MKQDLIKKWYNPELTDEQNVSSLKVHGIAISLSTLRRWRKMNNITKTLGGDRKSKEYKQRKNQVFTPEIKCSKSSSQNQVFTPEIKCSKSSSQNQDADLKNQSIKNEEIKVSKSENQSATFEEAEPLDWDNEDGKFMEIMPKGKITSEMYDKMFGDDSVPHYTGKTPPKQITLETFRNETGDLPVKDVKYYLSKNLPEVIDDAEEFKKWINATFYLLKGAKNWTDYLLHRETYSKVLAAANRGYSADYEKGTTVEQWQIQRAIAITKCGETINTHTLKRNILTSLIMSLARIYIRLMGLSQ